MNRSKCLWFWRCIRRWTRWIHFRAASRLRWQLPVHVGLQHFCFEHGYPLFYFIVVESQKIYLRLLALYLLSGFDGQSLFTFLRSRRSRCFASPSWLLPPSVYASSLEVPIFDAIQANYTALILINILLGFPMPWDQSSRSPRRPGGEEAPAFCPSHLWWAR